jgi:hypothetical protein
VSLARQPPALSPTLIHHHPNSSASQSRPGPLPFPKFIDHNEREDDGLRRREAALILISESEPHLETLHRQERREEKEGKLLERESKRRLGRCKRLFPGNLIYWKVSNSQNRTQSLGIAHFSSRSSANEEEGWDL